MALFMDGFKATVDPVDNVRRDNKDGAYHCPQCDTPFTRRSNLRRHFQIHTRNSLLKSNNCDGEYLTKQEPQIHSSTCMPMVWDQDNDAIYQIPESSFAHDAHSDTSATPALSSRTMDTFIYGPNYVPSPTRIPNFETPDTRYAGYHHPSEMSQTMSPLSSSGSVISPASPSSSSFDGKLASQSSPLVAFSFSHRRPSTSSSISSSSTSSSPYTHPIGHPHATCCYSCFSCTERQSNVVHLNGAPASPISPIDEPVYTRQQVKDMIDVVSECLIDTMENVMTRTQPNSLGSMPFESSGGQLVHSIRDADFRQTVISEAIPRVFYKIHSRGNDA